MDETPLLLFTPDVGICTGRYESFFKKWGAGPSYGGVFIWPDGSTPFYRYIGADPLDATTGTTRNRMNDNEGFFDQTPMSALGQIEPKMPDIQSGSS